MLYVNKRTVEQLIHSLNTVSRVCTIPEIPCLQSVIARCEQNMNWTKIEGFTIDKEIIDNKGTDVSRSPEKRFVISVPTAVIAAIVGALVIGTTSVVAATKIATTEAQRIVEEESFHRMH